MIGIHSISIIPLIIIMSIVGFVVLMNMPVSDTTTEDFHAGTITKNSQGNLKFGSNVRSETTPTTDTHGETTPTTDTHGETLTLNSKSNDGENAISINVFIMTNTGQKIHHNFQKVVQWTQQAYPDRLTPQLELDSVPSVDKEYLYNMVKQKFENNSNIDNVDIFLEATSKDNTIIISTKYIGCEIDQYWLSTYDEPRSTSLNLDNAEPHEQFFFKCKDYSVNSK